MDDQWWSWDDLPEEDLKQKILLRVPWHSLCRFRLVCPAWKLMISMPEFAYLHSTLMSRREPCVITATRQADQDVGLVPVAAEDDPGWHLLDITAIRTFTIPDTFVREDMLRDAGPPEELQVLGNAGPGIRIIRCTLVASGGLILAVYLADTTRSIVNPYHVVCNPVSESFQRIPSLPRGGYHKLTGMVVDAATQRYRIVHFRGDLSLSLVAPAYEVFLYDSWVRDWRKLCDMPGAKHHPRSCVVLDGVFYVMFEDLRDRRHELYSCDLETGEWCLIDVVLPSRPPLHRQASKARSQVVAAAGRLFFVEYSGEDAITVSVWRIPAMGISTPRVTRLVAQLPRFLTYHGSPVVRSMTLSAVAVGCGDSIVVANFEGRRVRWDVLRGVWHPLAPMNIGEGAAGRCHSFFVGAIDLQMRPLPAPQELGP